MSDRPKTLEEFQVDSADKLYVASHQNLNEAVTAARTVLNDLLPSIRSRRMHNALLVQFPLLERRIHEERLAEQNLQCAIRIRDREVRNLDHEKEIESTKHQGFYCGLAAAFAIINHSSRFLSEMQSEQLDELIRLRKEENATSITNVDRRNQIDKMQAEIDGRRAIIGVVHELFEAVSKRMDKAKERLNQIDPVLFPGLDMEDFK